MKTARHQFVERATGRVVSETLYRDRIIRFLYSEVREHAPSVFRAIIGPRVSKLIGMVNFDTPAPGSGRRFMRDLGIDPWECLDDPKEFDTARKVFERRIKYWDCRPMPEEVDAVVSPADARVLLGALHCASQLFIKNKFFSIEELLGKQEWVSAFAGGDFALFRLTPDKYHYNHTPVAGVVLDFYEIEGDRHSCNPFAVVASVTPYSKNKRAVTILDTDVPGGTGAGLTAMIEIGALMVGDVVQCYSEHRYDDPVALKPGMFLRKGAPKSLYRPGGSTDALLFQRGRISFSEDLIMNQRRCDVESRFSLGFGRPLAETEVRVRSLIGRAVDTPRASKDSERRCAG
jgi:phosphatidylserine decarboxylase